MSNENNNIITTEPGVAETQAYYKQQADNIINRAISNRRPLTFLDFKAISALNRAIKDLSKPLTRKQEAELEKEKRMEESWQNVLRVREAVARDKAAWAAVHAQRDAAKQDNPEG